MSRDPYTIPQELFVDLGCFEKICESLTLVKEEAAQVGVVRSPFVHAHLHISPPPHTHIFSYPLQNPDESCALVCQVFRAFTSVMKKCPVTREGFERRVGHYRLSQLVSAITKPSIDLLQEALNMVR